MQFANRKEKTTICLAFFPDNEKTKFLALPNQNLGSAQILF